MRGQRSLVDEHEPARRPCGICGAESTHRAEWPRPGDSPTAGVRARVGWLQRMDLCELHARRAVASEDPPRRLTRIAGVSAPEVEASPAVGLPGSEGWGKR